MILEHSGYSINAFATKTNRQWTVRMTVTWYDVGTAASMQWLSTIGMSVGNPSAVWISFAERTRESVATLFMLLPNLSHRKSAWSSLKPCCIENFI